MMKKRDVSVGHIYASRINGRTVPVRILYGIEKFGIPMRWMATNLATGEQVEIKTKGSLKYEMTQDVNGTLQRI